MTDWFLYLVPISYILPFLFTSYLSVVFYKSMKEIEDKINFAFLLFIVSLAEAIHNLYYVIATISRIFNEKTYDAMLDPVLWFFSQSVIAIAFLFLSYKVWITPQLRLGNISNYMDEIVKKEKFYNDFLAHEIRNYNIITLNAIQLMNEEGISDKLNLIDIANRSQLKLANLLSSITLFRGFEAENGWVIEKEEDVITAVDSFQDSVKLVEYLYSEKKVEVSVNAEENQILDLKGPFQTIIWNNLLSNSLKYSKGREIKIEFTIEKVDKNKLKITYKDNGKGIPEKQKRLMMKKNYKGVASHNGLGLGISLIKKIVKGVNGKFLIQNMVEEDHTQGTTFIFVLKRYAKNE